MPCPEFFLHAPVRRGVIVFLRECSRLLLLGMTCSMGSAQQSIPADIANRDKELRESMQREDARMRGLEHRALMENASRDMVRRFWEEPWLARSTGAQHDLVFPPVRPPVLHGRLNQEPIAPYPSFLLEYAGEPFFMACGNSYFTGKNDGHQVYRAGRYSEARDELVKALRAKLTAVASLPIEQQRTELAAFAAIQAKALQKLETEAEGTREEFSYLDDGRALMKEKNELPPEEATRRRAYYAALRSAHYQPGLLIEQRQLLESVAHETSIVPDAAAPIQPSFFLPASARILWLHSDDPTLRARWEAFQRLRREVADQLVHALLDLPPKISRSAARKFHADLADKQAVQFAELERRAEEIRSELAKNPKIKAPAESGHPPALIRLAGELGDRNSRFQDRAALILEEMNRQFAPSRFRMSQSTTGRIIEVDPAGATETGKRTKHARRLREANEWLVETQRTLSAAEEEAAKAIQDYHASLEPRLAPGVKQLTENLVQAYQLRENWERFADYRTAVLMPGLSSAQRRLLFNAALRDLEKYRLQAMD